MKKFALLAFLLIISCILEGGQCLIGNPQVIRHESFYQVLGPNGKTAIQIVTVPGSKLNEIQCQVEDGKLLVDTEKLFASQSKREKCVFRFFGPEIKDAKSSGSDHSVIGCFKLTISGPEKSTGILRFEGIRSNGKHFITHQDFRLLKAQETFVVKEKLPADLKKFWIVAVLTSPGNFEISTPYFYTEKQVVQKLDSSINYLPNGGAEHGFYGTIFIPPEARASAHNNQILDWRGIFEKPPKVDLACDDKVFHSGKRSFRFRMDSKKLPSVRGGIFLFQPVPYEAGSGISFSIWMKADHPTDAAMELTFGNGIGVKKSVKIGTEWKRYELYVPVWGKGGSDFKIQGQILNTFHTPPKCLIPKVTIRHNVTVWMDDAAVYLNGRGSYVEKASAFVRSAVLDHPDHTYFPGEEIHAKLELEGSTPQPRQHKISYIVYDLWEAEILRSGYRMLNLADGKKEIQNFAIKMPQHFRGPMNIVFSIDGGASEKVERVFYAGIVELPGKLNKRFSVEVPSAQNVEILLPVIKRFGIGMIRCGGASSKSVHNCTYILPCFKKNGIDVLLNYSITPAMRKNPKMSLQEHLNIFEEFMKKNSRYIDVLETENESNLFMSAEKTREVIREESRIARKIDPRIKIAGPAACKTEFSWIENALNNGGAKELDIVSEHPYRRMPEEPDYGEDCLAMRRLLDHYRPGLKHYATEAGEVQLPVLWNNRINDYLRNSQANVLRLALLGFGNGLESFNFFQMAAASSGINWNLLFMGTKENDGVQLPMPLLFAIRHAADMIEDGKACGQIPLSGAWRGIIFDKGDVRTAIIWKYKGVPANFSLKEISVTDSFGTKLNPENFTVGNWPVYIESKLSPKDLARILTENQPIDPDEPALELSYQVTDPHHFTLFVKNNINRSIEDIAIKIPGEEKKIARLVTGKKISETFRSKEKRVDLIVSGKKIRDQNLSIVMDGLFVAPHTGGFSEPISFPAENKVCCVPSEKEYLEKCSGTVSAAWDIEHLYFKITVNSPEYHAKPDRNKLDKIWMYDSVQIGFDTLSNGRKTDITLGDDDFEYAFGEAGGQSVAFRWKSSSSIHDSLTKNIGLTSDADVKITRTNGSTEYLIRFKPKGISPFKLNAGSTMRYNVLLNFHRNGKRIGFLQMSPGFGEKKCAGEWNNLTLLPAKQGKD